MDVSKSDAKVCVRVQGRGSRRTSTEITTWPARASSILELGQYLVREKVSCVVMEATSDYWKPFFYLLSEAGLSVVLANPRQVRQIPGRKTDVADAAWLADLAAHGLVRGSFVPGQAQREIKDLVRHRTQLVRLSGQEIQRLEKLLESASIKLSSVISDINGVSGRRMLQALIEGERDPQVLAGLGCRLKASTDELAEALTGRFTEHHGFLARLHLHLIDDYAAQISELDARIEGYFTDNDPAPEGAMTWGKARALLSTIPGVSDTTAEQILAEIGIDMSVFDSPGKLASWAGVAPGLNESAGKRHSSTCRPGNKHLKGALGMAALSAANSKHTFLAARFRRLTRRGSQRAVVALSRTLITICWHILTTGEPYHELGADYYDKRRPGVAIRNALNHLRQAGLTITPTPEGLLLTQT
nr:IS110 family transposase [Tessaracoccus flavus]